MICNNSISTSTADLRQGPNESDIKIIEFGVGKILETEKGKAALVALGLVVCGLVGGNHCAARTRDRQAQVVVVFGP